MVQPTTPPGTYLSRYGPMLSMMPKTMGRTRTLPYGKRDFVRCATINLADRVGVDEADVEDERDQMALEDDRLQVQVGGNQDPSAEEWEADRGGPCGCVGRVHGERA